MKTQAFIEFERWLDALDIPFFPSESEIELLTEAVIEPEAMPQPIDMLPENGSVLNFLV